MPHLAPPRIEFKSASGIELAQHNTEGPAPTANRVSPCSQMAAGCIRFSMPKLLNCVPSAGGLGALALTGMTPGGQDKGSTQRAKAGGDHNLIRTDHRARSLKSMQFLKSQATPTTAVNAAIAGEAASQASCSACFHPHEHHVGCSWPGLVGVQKPLHTTGRIMDLEST